MTFIAQASGGWHFDLVGWPLWLVLPLGETTRYGPHHSIEAPGAGGGVVTNRPELRKARGASRGNAGGLLW